MATRFEIWHYNTDTQRLMGVRPIKICNTLSEAIEHGERVFRNLQKMEFLTDNIGVEIVEVES